MSLITLNEEKCIKCGICIKECPVSFLKMGQNGPEEVSGSACIACGHCVAVCPKEAIDNEKSPKIKQVKKENITKLNSEEAENFLRSRRSIRSFKEIDVEREKLIKLADIAHFAPTASNSQGISYMIIDDKDTIRLAAETSANWLDRHPVYGKIFAGMIKNFKETGTDIILRSAPSIIVAMADKDFRMGRENSIFSLAYLELFAPSLGLGSCWAGVFECCALVDDSPILELLDIPKDKKITGVVMVGYPKHNFGSFTDRNSLDVTFYKK